jgi:predicted MFS family arabinose efflux permease
LQRFTPQRRRNLVFSIKQAGVPLGGVLAGAVLPPLIALVGWRATAGFAATLVLACVWAVAPLQAYADSLDDGRQTRPQAASGLIGRLSQPFRSLSSAPGLWRISLAGALLAIGQSCWFAFTVTYLVVELGLSLTAAGLIFAVMQGAGVIGRIGLGWVSDRVGSGMPVLMVAAVMSAATTALLGLTTPDWPIWSLVLLAALAGVSVSGWNGVQIAEVARRSPQSLVSETAAGSTILIFVANIVGPLLFTVFVTATGRFDIAFFGVAAACLLSLAGLLGVGRHVPPTTKIGA